MKFVKELSGSAMRPGGFTALGGARREGRSVSGFSRVEKRYSAGGNSGAGSYSQLAEFKAQVLNRFVATHDVKHIIEFGSGDGNQLALAEYPCPARAISA